MPTLSFINGPHTGHVVDVPERGITMGRSAACDLTITDTKMSREHANVRMQDGEWWVYDLKSSNGTLVNDQRAEAKTLADGDQITVGSTTVVFHTDGDAADDGGNPMIREQESATVERALKAAPEAEVTERPAADPAEAPSPRKTPTAAKRPKAAPLKATPDDLQVIKELNDAYARMTKQLSRVIIGQSDVIEQVLIAIFSRGHALLVGVPGLAKTLLVSTLSHVLDLSFKRVQFTPDLMPADITGTDVLEEDRTTGKRIFRFVKGPIFANMVLADEINRTPPKTQAALLEAMQEHRVTIGDSSYHLPEPFFVLATQNPIEQEGTYPLPEAQLDRFMFNIVVNYPTVAEERKIIKQVTGTYEAQLEVALTGQDILRLQQVVRRVPAADHVVDYAGDLARATRPKMEDAPDFVKEMVAWGAGPRAGIYLITAAKARAILQGRHHVTTEDVRAMAPPVLRHRVITTFNAEAAGVTSDQIVQMLIDHLKPVAEVDV